MKDNTDNVSPQEIDQLLQVLDEQIILSEDLLDKVEKIETLEIKKIEELKNLVTHSDNKKKLQDKIADIMAQMVEDMKSFKVLNDSLPGEMDGMMKTLQEMKNGSEPNDTADYWEERKKIDRSTVNLKTQTTKFSSLQKVYQSKKLDIETA